ncbi:hypothetical protein FOC4_g10006465 [Fusarium odoratissimum]|uniref:Uncharacterized protein n=1 Tax=Fusarium oxysporum f. sp. cubense (strain race 4) TaxID=2502994 RepID=N1RKW0_FUSC4|nr:hypothetical protein FOC4_g10006465 [Fusarium odoratissimum]
MALRCALHNWLYNKWYQPYRNDIEYHQFIAKLFYPCRPPPDMSSVSLVTLINELYGRICDQVATYQREVVTLPPQSTFGVQVPLHIAIDFITAQNQREIAVFGPQPDPLKSTLGFRNGLSVPPEDLPVVVSSLGGGDEPIEGPSSTWVDTTIHTGWPRVNAFDDERVYQWEEKRERWKLLREVAGVSLNYVRIHRRKSI